MLNVSGISKSTYYYHYNKRNAPDKDSNLKALISQIFNENKGRYGYRRITYVLKYQYNFNVNHKKVYRLMKSQKLACKLRIKKYKSYKGLVGKIAPNHLNRQFEADKPTTKWVTDITEFNIAGNKLYLSPIMDLYNGEIISYTTSPRPSYSMIHNMLSQATHQHDSVEGVILHSDQGWHYQMRQYCAYLNNNGIIQSMSRKGNCLDNASIESFFGHLKSELLHTEKFDDMENFKEKLDEYIWWYNNKRIKLKLKGLSPVQYRTQSSFTTIN